MVRGASSTPVPKNLGGQEGRLNDQNRFVAPCSALAPHELSCGIRGVGSYSGADPTASRMTSSTSCRCSTAV